MFRSSAQRSTFNQAKTEYKRLIMRRIYLNGTTVAFNYGVTGYVPAFILLARSVED